MDKIVIRGAREHNLKNINLDLPRDKFIVFTGISGSGKSTLAFDTIFAEGQRRYLESLSSYARQFLGQMDKPDVDYIEGLSPAISIDQKAASHNPRSTVGTVTEIHDYLRLLYAKIGIPHCSICGQEISKLSVDEIVDRILDLATPLSSPLNKGGKRGVEIEILAPVVRSRKGEYSTLLLDMYRCGFFKAYINKKKYELDPKLKLDLARYKKHNIDIVVDTVSINAGNISRIFEDVEKALKLADGIVKIKFSKRGPTSKAESRSDLDSEIIFNQKLSCPIHEVEFPEMEPRLFSFNSPYGACPACEGLGTKKEIDPDLVIPDKNKTVAEGAVIPWSYKKNNYYGAILRAVTNYYRIPDNVRVRDLSERQYNILVYGTDEPPARNASHSEAGGDDIPVNLRSKTGATWRFNIEWNGIVGFLANRYFKTESDAVREGVEKYMSQNPCSVCGGSRYKPETLLVTVGEKNINETSVISVAETLKFFEELRLSEREKLVAGRILKEVQNRLGFLENVGLGYLTLARAAFSLAGGETQRIRLASQIGSQLVGVLYILDEPSVGLHSRDNAKLLETLLKLRDIGNTLIVIEHDEETMRAADFLVDIGPGAGKLGGEIVASGTPEEVIRNKKSLTAKYLRRELEIEVPKFRRPVKNKKWLTVRGASQHNLKDITVEFPLKVFTTVTGVSGSGKSTLVEDILYKSLSSKLMRSLERPGRHKEIIGTEYLDKVIMIDQSPIGRTPRSNPATYTGLFTPIRELFASTKDAKAKGYLPGRFSFNVRGGRCDNCDGDGFLKIEMQFMPDVYLPCDVCKGKRYNRETLDVRYKEKNISEVLEMTVGEASEFFHNFPEIHDKLMILEEVGLEYIHLGQAATTLSGGEAQRIKLATELSRRATGNTLYILDEPTTGLHFDDIKKLLGVLNQLVDAGNTVVVIEHNLDVIKTADWIIDLGPEGGDEGGRVVVTGEPEEVAKYHKESYTAKYLKELLMKK
ncbi:MAG: excinuclease ABC subunit UvrA [Candidatus Moranbacteria bacterium CG_4_9_14_3_um_filter_42_9]|nr:MAG: excinuclease ABC subunit UvrA [Candidatus Moranbacteria bacterium CG_4_9_14_3_um_filter_42_9]